MRGRKASSARLAESNSNAGQGRVALLVSTRWVNLSRVPSCSGWELSKARKVLGGYLPGGMEYPRCGPGSLPLKFCLQNIHLLCTFLLKINFTITFHYIFILVIFNLIPTLYMLVLK